MLVDSHAHLDDKRFEPDPLAEPGAGLEDVLARARDAGVGRIITVGTDIASSEAAITLAERNRGMVFASVGIHPHEATHADERAVARLEELASSPGVVAVGETGLDYHRDRSPHETQKSVFAAQIGIALKLNLPVVIHCRDAYEDCLPILARYAGRGLRGVAHCFGGDRRTAETLVAMGFLVSLSGTLTYPNAGELREVARFLPLDKVLVETDSPYLAPQLRRGARNEPAFVKHVAEALAAVRGISLSEAAEETAANAVRLFRLAGKCGQK